MKKEFIDDIVTDVKRDFEAFRAARRPYETQWRLNMDFYRGKQYSESLPSGEIAEVPRDYYWQEREVFNHIAAIVETRLAKLNSVRPSLTVRPFSSDDEDIKTAKTSAKILKSVCDKLNIDAVLSGGTLWSELCGTAFYKVDWDSEGGAKFGDVCEGEAVVQAVSPFEIYPCDPTVPTVGGQSAIIRARAVEVAEIKRVYGKTVQADGGIVYLSAVADAPREQCDTKALVIERYRAPTAEKPQGELAIVAGGTLLHYGELPYINGTDGRREYPFVKQDSIANAGSFFGTCAVERAIPVQRAYNAVKNRKHEFINRLSMGVLAVEDGSVDVDALEQDGICPGKIIVYRQGSTPPRMIDCGSVPSEFDAEETRLLSEFNRISGVSEIMRSGQPTSNITSGVALQLLIEQDDTRLSLSAEYVRLSARDVARQILRLYKQFACGARLSRISGNDGKVELLRWTASDISSDDVIFETDNELLSTPAMRQNMMLELYKTGLLFDDNGKMTQSAKQRFMEALGYGGWNNDFDLSRAHTTKAENENVSGKYALNDFDAHEAHIDAHVKYLVTECSEKRRAALESHIRDHKKLYALAQSAQGANNELDKQN